MEEARANEGPGDGSKGGVSTRAEGRRPEDRGRRGHRGGARSDLHVPIPRVREVTADHRILLDSSAGETTDTSGGAAESSQISRLEKGALEVVEDGSGETRWCRVGGRLVPGSRAVWRISSPRFPSSRTWRRYRREGASRTRWTGSGPGVGPGRRDEALPGPPVVDYRPTTRKPQKRFDESPCSSRATSRTVCLPASSFGVVYESLSLERS